MWIFFTKKGLNNKRKRSVAFKKGKKKARIKLERIPKSNLGPLDWNVGANYSNT